MTQYRKPIPKSQKEISKNLIEPYNDGEGKFIGQNPNFPISPNQSNTGIEFNRGEKRSLRGETDKIQTIGIQDIDEAIMYYFNNVIKPSVEQNGKRINVPIIYGAPERMKSSQKDGYYRDKKGAIMYPLIMFKRTSVEKNRTLTNKLDANNPFVYTFTQKKYSSKNFYSNFNLLNNREPIVVKNAIVVPDYVNLNYTCAIQTYYVEQLNRIVEDINYASDSYWGDPERFKFNARIDSFNITTQLDTGVERAVKAEFELKMNGYLIPDNIQKDTSAIKTYTTKTVLSNEIVVNNLANTDVNQKTENNLLGKFNNNKSQYSRYGKR